jgi:hypothetical protein
MKNVIKTLATSLAIACAPLLSVGAASAEDAGGCSTANAAGAWGYTITGTNTTAPNPATGLPPPGADAIVGSGIVNATGTVALKQIEVTNGQRVDETVTGNVTVSRDCTATLTVQVTLPQNLVVKATWALVYVDNQREIRGILTSLSPLPPGQQLAVQTLNGKRLFPGRFAPF